MQKLDEVLTYKTLPPESHFHFSGKANVQKGQYVAIRYRTTKTRDGRLYIGSQDDRPNDDWPHTGNDGVMLDWNPTGEWELLIVPLSSSQELTGEARYIDLSPFCVEDGSVPRAASIDIAYIAFFDSEEDARAFDTEYSP